MDTGRGQQVLDFMKGNGRTGGVERMLISYLAKGTRPIAQRNQAKKEWFTDGCRKVLAQVKKHPKKARKGSPGARDEC